MRRRSCTMRAKRGVARAASRAAAAAPTLAEYSACTSSATARASELTSPTRRPTFSTTFTTSDAAAMPTSETRRSAWVACHSSLARSIWLTFIGHLLEASLATERRRPAALDDSDPRTLALRQHLVAAIADRVDVEHRDRPTEDLAEDLAS